MNALLHRIGAAALVAVFLLPPLAEGLMARGDAGSRWAGARGTRAACCGTEACCRASSACAPGHCAAGRVAALAGGMTGAAGDRAGARWTAGCAGPTPAATPSDRDPMIPALAGPLAAAMPTLAAEPPSSAAAPTRPGDPAVPPPRA